MTCEMLRACYSTKARLIEGRPDLLQDIRWYWCEEGALALPHPSAVNSLNYYDDARRNPGLDLGTIGEVPAFPRPFRNGTLPGGVVPPGEQFCGPASWYTNGTPEGGTYPRADNGPLLACFLPPPPDGSLLLDGFDDVTVTDHEGPTVCPGGPATVPNGVSVTASEFADMGGDVINGGWVLTRQVVLGVERGWWGFRPRTGGGFWSLIADPDCHATGMALHPSGGTGVGIDNGDGTVTWTNVALFFTPSGDASGGASSTGFLGKVTCPGPPP